MTLQRLWAQVPADYFSKGTSTNLLQKMWHGGKLRAVAATIPTRTIHTLVDVGSADGSFMARLNTIRPIRTIVAADPYLPPLRQGRSLFHNLQFVQSDAHRLPIRSASIDVVTICETLEHVLDPYAVLLELKRITQPKGVVIVEMDSGSFLFQIVWFLWKKFGKGIVWRDSHLTFFNTTLLESLFANSGFKIEEKRLFNWGMGACYRLKRR